MPCLRAFWEEVCLPEGVRGPVESWALRRLAAIWAGEAMWRSFLCVGDGMVREARAYAIRPIGIKFRTTGEANRHAGVAPPIPERTERLPMTTVAQLARTLQTVLTTTAETAARESGFIQRHRKLTGAAF